MNNQEIKIYKVKREIEGEIKIDLLPSFSENQLIDRWSNIDTKIISYEDITNEIKIGVDSIQLILQGKIKGNYDNEKSLLIARILALVLPFDNIIFDI